MTARIAIGTPTIQIPNRDNRIAVTISASTMPIMRSRLPAPRGGTLRQVDHDEALFGQLAESIVRPLAGVPGVLHAAVRHLIGAEGRRFVDRDPAEVEALGRDERRLQVAREDPRLETVARRVRELDRLVQRARTRDGDDRAEDLVARHL